jgi:UDP-N-acetylmuramate--alanine ligase
VGDRPDLGAPRRVHLVGIGGAGMSAIAAVLAAMGHAVSGSDAAGSPVLDRLEALGVRVRIGHDPSGAADADVVAASTAIPADNAELVAVTGRGQRVWRRAELLAAICATRRTVAVSGSHGKTTTSAMLAAVLRHAGRRPSMIIGGDIAGIGSGASWEPQGEWLVVEADESDGTFLQLGAEAVVVTSVGSDHLDFFGDIAALRTAFQRFVDGAPGPAVVCADDPAAAALVPAGGDPRCRTYGTTAGADVRIVDVALSRSGSTFSVVVGGRRSGPYHIGLPGLHNVRNATAALAIAHAIGVPWEEGAAGLAGFAGVGRRFEVRGVRDGVTYVDDYGHNPDKVRATLAAARAGGWGRVVVLFQPHRYSRTEYSWTEFADAFEGADVLVVTDIYGAGEAPRPGVTGRLISDAVRAAHPDADVRDVGPLEDGIVLVRSILRPGDLCLTLGAGDVTVAAARLLGGEDGEGTVDRGSRRG